MDPNLAVVQGPLEGVQGRLLVAIIVEWVESLKNLVQDHQGPDRDPQLSTAGQKLAIIVTVSNTNSVIRTKQILLHQLLLPRALLQWVTITMVRQVARVIMIRLRAVKVLLKMTILLLNIVRTCWKSD